jgi:hypothetical protein
VKEKTMSAQHPKYWLAYLSESPKNRPNEITTTAPEILHRPRFTHDAQVLLAAADAYQAVHPHHRVVFAAAVTRWLHTDRGLNWDDFDIDFYEALADLDAHTPQLLIEASPIARAVVGNAADELTIFMVGEPAPITDIPTEPVRAAILEVLERDWPPYITGALARQAQRAG